MIKSATIWGVRGAFAASDAAFSEYGGNTSCIAVDCGKDLIVLDAGSGITRLDAVLAGRPQFRRIHILLSHLHLDHIQGLMSFQPLFDESADIHIYGERYGNSSLRECLARVLGPPYWPIGFDDLPSRPKVHEVEPGTSFSVAGGLTVRTLCSCHPNSSLLFRIEDEEVSIVYALDCELTEGLFPELAAFAWDCSLLIWDANFTDADLKRGWGHSTWKQGIDVGKAAGAGQVLMTHYDRTYTDVFLHEQEHLAKQIEGTCIFAREGMVIEL